jgi:sortase (surface protein transpeptidase)
MDIMDVIKNPVMIGLFAGLITYIYLHWKNSHNKNKDKSQNDQSTNNGSKNKNKEKKKNINLLIPLAVFIVFWFISYAYFSNEEDIIGQIEIPQEKIELLKKSDDINIKILPTQNANTGLVSETSDPKSFQHISNGLHIPSSLPDVFFQMI